MSTSQFTLITVETVINAPIQKVWNSFTAPDHITKWYFASDDWHAPKAENDIRTGGKFLTRMEAKDGSFGFDFEGIYDVVRENEYIEYHLADERIVKTFFIADDNKTKVVQQFDAEKENPIEMQRGGWQAILDNFKKHTESIIS
jgi:uncharacterized protein YndB with AHSA1/START domain